MSFNIRVSFWCDKTESMYNRLRAVKTMFDPNDLFHYSLGLPLIDKMCDDDTVCKV